VLENGKAKLVSDVYCDGLGDCLPECPTGAIEIIEREAAAFDEEAVNKRLAESGPSTGKDEPGEVEPGKDMQEKSFARPDPVKAAPNVHATSGCPGSRMCLINRGNTSDPTQAGVSDSTAADFSASGAAGVSASDAVGISPSGTSGSKDRKFACEGAAHSGTGARPESQLRQWPCQIRLVSPRAPYFDKAHLLVAADCTAYAYAGIHQDYMKDRITIIGCPKLDQTDYSEKLAEILANNDIQSITVLRMEVPCCGGLVQAVKDAMLTSRKVIPWNVVTVSIDGDITEQRT
jgi:ferredoxin